MQGIKKELAAQIAKVVIPRRKKESCIARAILNLVAKYPLGEKHFNEEVRRLMEDARSCGINPMSVILNAAAIQNASFKRKLKKAAGL